MAEQAQHADHKHQRQVQPTKPVQQGPVRLAAEAEFVDLLALQRAVLNLAQATPGDILGLQRTAGNRAVSRLISTRCARDGSLQTKLTVGGAGDRYEQEADRVAEQVMTIPAPRSGQPSADFSSLKSSHQPALQRQEDEEEVQTKPLAATITPLVQRHGQNRDEEGVQTKPLQRQDDEEEVQTKPLPSAALPGLTARTGKTGLQRRTNAADSFEAGPEIENRLSAHKGNGHPLPHEVRTFMEPRFGADFSGVRVHADGQAADLNRRLSAQAFTHGQDIYLGANKHDPGTTAGKRLLAHELTHVVQQTGGGSAHNRFKAAQTKPSEALQRDLAFKPGDLKGQLTFKAKAAGFFGKKSTWARIQETLQRYWADSARPVALLLELDDLADRWLANHGLSSDRNDQLKMQSLTTLKAKIGVELGSALPSTGTAALPTTTTTAAMGTATQPTTTTTATTAKHTPPAHPIPATPTATATTATTAKALPTPPPKISLQAQAVAELGQVGIAPQLLAKFPPADLQHLLDAHRKLTARDVAAADSAFVALRASTDPTVGAVFNIVKTCLLRHHIGVLQPEVQKVFNPAFKLSPSAPLDQVALKTARDYLMTPEMITKSEAQGPALPLGTAAANARATLLQFQVLEPEEVLAIEAYTSALYSAINGALRARLTSMTQKEVAWAQSAVSGLHKLPKLTSVPEVYRHDSKYPGFLETHHPGAIVTDFAFKSSAQKQEGCSAGGENHQVLSVIRQESGRDVSGTAYFGAGEAEVLFPPGTKFMVTERAERALSSADWQPASVKPKAELYWNKEARFKATIDTILFMKEVK
jgi:hypothetical protein